jgi:hypothetical protein
LGVGSEGGLSLMGEDCRGERGRGNVGGRRGRGERGLGVGLDEGRCQRSLCGGYAEERPPLLA